MFKRKNKEVGPVINEFTGRDNQPLKSSPEPAFDEVKEEDSWHERNEKDGFIPIEDIPDNFDEDKILAEIDESLEKEGRLNLSLAEIAAERTKRSIALLKKYGEKEVAEEQKRKIFFNHIENIKKEVERMSEEYFGVEEAA